MFDQGGIIFGIYGLTLQVFFFYYAFTMLLVYLIVSSQSSLFVFICVSVCTEYYLYLLVLIEIPKAIQRVHKLYGGTMNPTSILA